MQNLGEKLKSLRIDLGLTQTEMAAGVISVSFYSKVERGLHGIGAAELLEILEKHDINAASFFSDKVKIDGDINEKKVVKLANRFIKAATEDNDAEIVSIIADLEKITPKTPFLESLTLQAKLIANTHDDDAIKKLNEKQKNEIKKIIFQKDTTENEYLRIVMITNIMQIYSFDEASFLIKNTIRRYKDVNNLEKKIEIALSAMMINYVNWCFSEGEISLCYEPLEYIKKLPNNFELAFSKILGQYFEDLLNHRPKDANKIRDVLSEAGYQVYVQKIVKTDKK